MNDKEIEEMAKCMCDACLSIDEPCYMKEQPCYIAKKQAENLYKAGYRKIPENAVVLTKEEQEYLETISENIIGQLEKELQLLEQQTRKETAREILQKIESFYAYYEIDCTLRECMQEIAKQYGVDLGE